MTVFPNAKINIGLHVTQKRADGYHNIETVFYPIALTDVLEIDFSDKNTDYEFYTAGNVIDGKPENNLIIKALMLLKNDFEIPPLRIRLQKNIPMGAGLGGGSADAAFMLQGINKLCNLHIADENLEKYAAQLGADCAVFIQNRPVFAQGTGNVFSPVTLCLKGLYLVIVKPDIHVSTAAAYAGVAPQQPAVSLAEKIKLPLTDWKNTIVNDFEPSVFARFEQIAHIKQQLYALGACYAAMSGSGSAVFALFEQASKKNIENLFQNCFVKELRL